MLGAATGQTPPQPAQTGPASPAPSPSPSDSGSYSAHQSSSTAATAHAQPQPASVPSAPAGQQGSAPAPPSTAPAPSPSQSQAPPVAGQPVQTQPPPNQQNQQQEVPQLHPHHQPKPQHAQGQGQQGQSSGLAPAPAQQRSVPAVAPAPSQGGSPSATPPSPAAAGAAETPAKEDEEVSYVVGILAKPKKHKAGRVAGKERKRVRMTSKSGVEFSCELPGPADPSDEEQAQQDAVTPEAVVEVLKQRLSKGPCFERTVGYWAYKVCPFREVTQFHRESNGALSSVFHLGHYDPQADKAPSSLTPYSQAYTKGTGDRNSEVRYVCPTDKEKSSKSKAYETTVASVSEPWALHYELEVHTQHACLAVREKDGHKTASSSQSVLSLLTPLKGKCFQHVAGWWTYEFCYLDRVRQYHAELVSPEGKEKEAAQGGAGGGGSAPGTKHVVTAEYVLGRMDKGVAADWLEKNTAINRRTTVEDSFVGQLYKDGTNCDLTNKPREITVQFFCDSKDGATRVSGVAETATCQYTMNVYTSLLCDHPYFKPKQPKVKTIVCEPVRNVFTGEAM